MHKTIPTISSFLLLLAVLFSCRPENKPEPEQPPADAESSEIHVLQSLTEKIEQNPDSADLYFARCNAYVQLGNFNNALADIQHALELDSTSGQYYSALAHIYFSREEFTRAVLTLEKGHKEAPDDLDLTLQFAKYQLYLGEHVKSIELLDEVLKKNRYRAEAYFLKGMIFKEIGDTAKSISNFQTAVEQNPRQYEAYMQLGLLLSKRKDPLALDYFNNALKIDSMSYEARYGTAIFHQEAGKNAQALELYRKIVLDFPQEKDAYYNLGYIHFQMDSIERASRDFDRAIAVAPDYADAYYMRGLCAEVKKDFASAKHYYQQTLNLNPQHQLALNGLNRMEKI